jgi:hypothetical protein
MGKGGKIHHRGELARKCWVRKVRNLFYFVLFDAGTIIPIFSDGKL